MPLLHHPRILTLLLSAGLTACTAERIVPVSQVEFDPERGLWVDLPPPQPGTPEGDLGAVRGDLAAGNTRAAIRGGQHWLETHGPDHTLSRDARLVLAEAEHGAGNFHKSYTILKELTAEFGTDEITERALELQFNIAEVFLSGRKRKVLGLRLLPARDLGIRILDEISGADSGGTLAEDALLTKGDYYFNRGDFALAEDEYGHLIEGFPRSRRAPHVHLRRAQAALARFPGIAFDDGALIEAEERFLRYRGEFPRAAERHGVDLVLENIRNRRAQKELAIGDYYVRTGRRQAGVFYYRSVLRNWGGTLAASQAEAALASLGVSTVQAP